MAKTDLETLVVRMEAQMKAFENELKRGRQTADRETRAIEKRFADANKKLATGFAGAGTALRQGLGLLGIGLGAREIQRFADQYTSIQNALKVAGLQGQELTRVYEQLFVSAQKNAAPLEALTTLYSRAALVQKELNISSAELLQFTDKIALALRVSGQSAAQSSGALLQLSQALGSGVVRAEEFNSILEGALPIAQAAAAGLEDAGGSVAKLRALIVDGKVSSEAFFRAFQAGSSTLEARAAGMQLTIGQALEQLQNVFIDVIGRINKVTGASAEAVRLIQDLSAGLKWIADNVEQIVGPYNEIAKAIRGVGDEASTAARWLARLRGLTPTGIAGNIARYIAGAGATDPEATREAARARAFSDLPAPSNIKPVKLSDFPVTGTKDKVAKRDPFERALDSASKRIEVLKAETAAIDGNTAARERAKLVAELEVAAKARNEAAGLKNIEVTDAQRAKINEMADAMYRVVDAAEEANNPLAQFARDAAQVGRNLQEAGVAGLRSFEDALVDIVTGASSAQEAFRNMANAIIADLTRIAIRAAITGPIAGAFGIPIPGRASGGPVRAGSPYVVGERGPELFVPNKSGAIVPNQAARRMAGGGTQVTYAPSYHFAAGIGPADMALIQSQIAMSEQRTRNDVTSIVRGDLYRDKDALGI